MSAKIKVDVSPTPTKNRSVMWSNHMTNRKDIYVTWQIGNTSDKSENKEDCDMCYVLDYFYATHTQTIIETASFPLSWSSHEALTLIIVLLHRDPCYHCMIWSSSSSSVRYNLPQVQLSLVDAYQPLLSFTYFSIYNEKYINCTTRRLRP